MYIKCLRGIRILKKKDVFLIILAVFVSFGLFLANRIFSVSGDSVNIYVDSKLYKSVKISENQTVEINGTNKILIEDGKVSMIDADCPDKLCIKQGKITDNSKDIVCLPNGVVIRVEKNSELDAVSE